MKAICWTQRAFTLEMYSRIPRVKWSEKNFAKIWLTDDDVVDNMLFYLDNLPLTPSAHCD